MRRGVSRISTRSLESVQAEIAQEKAAALSRVATRLQKALARSEDYDSAPGAPGNSAIERSQLVSAAGEALWFFVVQREACGLGDTESVLREFRASREVHLRMGLCPSRNSGTG